MDVSEDYVAQLLARDAAHKAERAKEFGVTAYMQKPVHRARPNEQFLQATIRNIQSGNRRTEENAMWRHRQAQLSDYRPQRTEGTGAPNTEDQLADDRWHTQDDEATLDMLSSRTVRGRGGVGSRTDEAGPYLPADMLHSRDETEHAAAQPPVAMGPDRPAWMHQSRSEPTETTCSPRPNRSLTEGAGKRRSKLKGSGSSKRHKSDKHKKQSKLKHRHKHRD